MWKNIKKRWEHLFDDHEQQELNNQTTNTSYKSIETKMAYQYPKKNANERLTRKPIHKNQRKKSEETVDYHHNEYHHQEPFKAQDVPSPVYGFRSNQKKLQDQRNEDLEKTVEQDTDNEHSTEEQDSNGKMSETTKSVTLDNDSEIQQKPTNNRVEVTNSIESRKERKKERNQNTPTPLNVIMTPRDKWRQQKKQEVTINRKRNEDQVKTLSGYSKEYARNPRSSKWEPY
ncbi:hypothetical protein [Gracilibacillus massiliensis]|uniref:hypothetical protein n=1 Tax=Gracilibacillus massiliensis TaxID=1564956 RepID=UPI0009EBFFF6|nr:hypothetical protein [Gracilibacillus massiliensis]